MTNTTLEKMQEIEQAAEDVLASYEDQIKSLRDEKAARLEELSLVYDKETEASALSLAKKKEEEIRKLEQDLELTVQSNQEKVEAALTDKKADLARDIVEKVVEAYGH
ncbi:hypothetical protein DW726_02995 [Streptococcus gordonii]|uniref:hypothetical protein n=1 Tax=Streptococcus gordonii TaxID=1302 RepID=UPI000E4E8C08|nr:hypothetical protein [Streptococcus gordonii]RHE65093.1 hypothetical protein DW726_02995 [Streptococcus gordonii]